MHLSLRTKHLSNVLLSLTVLAISMGCANAPVANSDTPTPPTDSAVASPPSTRQESEARAEAVVERVPSPTAAVSTPLAIDATPTNVPAAVPTAVPTSTPTPAATATSTVVPSPTSRPMRADTSSAAPTAPPTAVPAAVPQAPAIRSNTRLLREQAKDIAINGSDGVASNGDVIQLAKQADGTYAAKGVLLSQQRSAEFPFDNAVLSWNAETPPGTSMEFQIRVGSGGVASPWFTMGTWSSTGGASSGQQGNAWGSVDVDTLKLAKDAATLQYRVTFTTVDPASSPRLRSVAVVYSNLSSPLSGPKPAPAGWARDLPVPQYSQLEQDPSVAREICSATSLTMVLNFWGKGKSVREVYQGVRDGRIGIFGNWALNAAYAGSLGFDAYVDRFYSLEQLQSEIAAGRPVIISIRFNPGELDNSPISSTTGHLIVVRGFTAQGDVIVNDPIAPSSGQVRRIYKRDQLGSIWQKSGGVVYVVRPR